MSVEVMWQGGRKEFKDGANWHVDEEGNLYVRNEKNVHIGTFARGTWMFAHSIPKETQAQICIDGKAIHAALLDLKRKRGGNLGLA